MSWTFPRRPVVAAALAVTLGLGVAQAVDTSYWTHSKSEDFAAGEAENVVVTNFGELKLARELTPLARDLSNAPVVFALAETQDGTVYAGTGPEGVLLAIKDGQTKTIELDGAANLFSLLADGNDVLVGTGGERGRVVRVSPDGTQKVVFDQPGVRYVWSITRGEGGTLYVATGPEGQLYAVTPGGEWNVVYDAPQPNLISLTQARGKLYAGTDEDGHVLQIDPASGKGFVLFDANESEIVSLHVDDKGDLFAGASGQPGAEAEEEAVDPSRPDAAPVIDPIEGEPAEMPEMPEPAPPRPDPIPVDVEVEPAQDEPDIDIPDTPEPPEEIPGPGDDEGEPAPEEEPVPEQPAQTVPGPEGERQQQISARALSRAQGAGSVVYRIRLSGEPAGFAIPVFAEPPMLFTTAKQNGKLLVATGNDGQLFQLDPSTGERSLVAQLDSQQVTALLPTADGRVLLATSNPGSIRQLEAGVANEGTFTSEILDAGGVSQFGTMQLLGSLPAGTSLQIQTRSGNTADPETGGWSDWSEPTDARRFLPIQSPSARYLQYRLSFTGSEGKTPTLEQLRLAYQLPNLPPILANLSVTGDADGATVAERIDAVAAGAAGSRSRAVSWQATDPNGDALRYTLSYRRGRSGEWMTLATDVAEKSYDWNTAAVEDGEYEIRVEATDAAGNVAGSALKASRVSAPVLVDNRPPTLGDVQISRENGQPVVNLRVTDASGIVARLEYAVGGLPGATESAGWQRALPEDKMADSPDEAYVLRPAVETDPAPVLRVRAFDDQGNVAYLTLPLAGQ